MLICKEKQLYVPTSTFIIKKRNLNKNEIPGIKENKPLLSKGMSKAIYNFPINQEVYKI